MLEELRGLDYADVLHFAGSELRMRDEIGFHDPEPSLARSGLHDGDQLHFAFIVDRPGLEGDSADQVLHPKIVVRTSQHLPAHSVPDRDIPDAIAEREALDLAAEREVGDPHGADHLGRDLSRREFQDIGNTRDFTLVVFAKGEHFIVLQEDADLIGDIEVVEEGFVGEFAGHAALFAFGCELDPAAEVEGEGVGSTLVGFANGALAADRNDAGLDHSFHSCGF